MIVRCKNCETQYTLNPAQIKPGGQTVRCTECGNSWFQNPPTVVPAAAKAQVAKEAPEIQPSADPVAPEAVSADVEADVFETVDAKAVNEDVAADIDFRETLITAEDEAAQNIPAAIKPDADDAQAFPVFDHIPAGMTPVQFGVSSLLLLLFLTLIPLLLLRGPITKHAPMMASFYETFGISVAAPGEGLRLSEMVAEARMVAGVKKLFVDARLTNLSKATKEPPKIKINVLGPYGASLKEWIVQTEVTRLASGDAVPVTLSFDDVPVDGQKVTMRVVY